MLFRSETFSDSEIMTITEYLTQKFAKTGNAEYMASVLDFQIGLRAGELVSLKWCDIDAKKRILTVQRTEIKEYDEECNRIGLLVSEGLKAGHRSRQVPLAKKAIEIFDDIRRQQVKDKMISEWVFVAPSGKRAKEGVVSKWQIFHS